MFIFQGSFPETVKDFRILNKNPLGMLTAICPGLESEDYYLCIYSGKGEMSMGLWLHFLHV
jgi:hypothetical protein